MGLPVQHKQPNEVKAVGVSYVDFLAASGGDAIASATASITDVADGTLVIDSVGYVGGVVKVKVSAGTSGQTYKVTVKVTTAGGLVEEVDFRVKVRDT